MHWYLVHTKPRQEACALQNLNQQGYDCYLPLLSSEKLLKGQVAKTTEPLAPATFLYDRIPVIPPKDGPPSDRPGG